MSRKKQMPRYYGRNILRNAERKFFQRKVLEANAGKRREGPADSQDGGKKD